MFFFCRRRIAYVDGDVPNRFDDEPIGYIDERINNMKAAISTETLEKIKGWIYVYVLRIHTRMYERDMEISYREESS